MRVYCSRSELCYIVQGRSQDFAQGGGGTEKGPHESVKRAHWKQKRAPIIFSVAKRIVTVNYKICPIQKIFQQLNLACISERTVLLTSSILRKMSREYVMNRA